MILIFGGAYQGKLDYARKHFAAETVSSCVDGLEPDFTADIIDHIEAFADRQVREGKEPLTFFQEQKDRWCDKILICGDVSQGVVPVSAEERAFREANGRLLIYLAGEAEQVIRVFCGLGKRIK